MASAASVVDDVTVETSSSRSPPVERPINATERVNQNFDRHRLYKSKYTHFHIVVFVLTFVCNTIVHGSRKSFGNVKSIVSEEWTPSASNATVAPKKPDDIWNSHDFFPSDNDPDCKNFLGGLDTAFMMSYAVGLFISGIIGDRFNVRIVLCIGLLGNAVTVFLFACVGEWFQLYAYWWYLPLWILNGLFQSSGMPCMITMMGNWFGKSHRGFIFGLWSTCASVGNIVGSILVSSFLDYGYEMAMLVPAVIVACVAVMMFFGIVVKPEDVGLPSPDADNKEPPPLASNPTIEETERLTTNDNNEVDVKNYGSLPDDKTPPKINVPIGFFEALLLPGVIIYSMAYAFVKVVHYSFFYWLPFYLNRQYQWTPDLASSLSAWYDVGGIFGAIAGGYVSDKLRRSPVLGVMLLAATPILYIYKSLPNNTLENSVVLFFLGIFIGGVVNIMSATIAADLGRQPKLKGNSAALSTVTGIMDGIGSIGAAVGQLLVPIIQNGLGWQAVFDLFIICLGLTFLCLLPIIYREMKELSCWHEIRHCSCCCRRGDSHHEVE